MQADPSPTQTIVAEELQEKEVEGGDPENLVHWQPNDAGNPFNWSNTRKCFVVFIVGLQMLWVTMMSSIFAPASSHVQEEFGIPAVQSKLPLALYLFGFGFGPVVLTPFAEDYGRKYVFTICMVVSYVLAVGCALAQNIATLAILRFLAGFFASPIFNSVCNIPDLFRGTDVVGLWALNFWALAAESIILGPLFGGYIVHRLSWRWIFWIGIIIGFGLMVLFLLFVPETRGGPLLVRRAKKARKHGDLQAWALHERLGRRSVKEIVQETVLRPVVMLTTEPIVFLFGLWDGLNYGIIYLTVESAPLIYKQYGFTEPNINLVFIAMQVGFFIAMPLFYFQRRATLRIEQKTRQKDVPEHKLLWGMVAGILFPVSLYWFAWSSQPSVNYLASMFALCAFGISSHVLFLVVSDYTVESYGVMASSAITGQSLFREILSGVLTLVAVPFYQNVGYQWATCILAMIATPMAFLPFVFYRFGPRIRAASRYAQELARLEREEREHEKWIEARAGGPAQTA